MLWESGRVVGCPREASEEGDNVSHMDVNLWKEWSQ